MISCSQNSSVFRVLKCSRSAKRPLLRAKRKAPAFHCIFKYARQSLASSFDIARRYAELNTNRLRLTEVLACFFNPKSLKVNI